MNNILTISEITGKIKGTLEKNYDDITIRGEISNYKAHSSGHRYFSLKDENAQISCVVWRSTAAGLNFRPENGMKVIADGGITVFPPRGNYQINIRRMRPDGLGELYLAYEKLKNELEEKGWFDASRKRVIPQIPQKIGVSTSPTGAAVRDILSTIKRRLPSANIVFRPTVVQGAGSSLDIVKAIDELNSENPDVIIIGRGGGSIEDLWAYNTLEVAESIYKSKAPIISAVGHETDFTIADFVADLRAPTPTGAAEMSTSKTEEYLLEIIEQYKNFFDDRIKNKIKENKDTIERFTGERVKNILKSRINFEIQRADNLEDTIKKSFKFKFDKIKTHINNLESLIKLSDPKRPLQKGYALLKKGDKVIGSKESIKEFKDFEIHRLNETAQVKLKKVFPKEMF